LFLPIKRLSPQGIGSEFVIVLGLNAIPYSRVTEHRGQRQFPSVPCDTSERPPNTVIDNAILNALKKQPVSSIRELAKFTCIPTTTVHRHLTPSLGFVVKHLRRVPHSLTDTQKA
jgi:hypothetical protein